MRVWCLMALLAMNLFSGTAVSRSIPDLKKSFSNPPDDCRPQVLWQWMGGLISKEGITKDLEAMAEQGIGGTMIMLMPDQAPFPFAWSYRDYPGKVKVLSDEYFGMINFAIGESDRLGLELRIFMCPGWSHCGGPWVPVEKSIKRLSYSKTTVTGPSIFDNLLVSSEMPSISWGGSIIPHWNKDFAKKPDYTDDYRKNIAVLATPELEAADSPIDPDKIIVLTEQMDETGKLAWNIPKGKWNIWKMDLIPANNVNHPADVNAIGRESDRMDPEAVRIVYEGMVGRINKEARAKGYTAFKGFETDSYEGGYQDFGLDFADQFKKRRGYDCIKWLPAWKNENIIIKNRELTERYRNDMRRTVSELWEERFHGELRRLADENGLEWLVEPYWGSVLDWRSISGKSTTPGTEFWVRTYVDDQGQLQRTSTELVGDANETSILYGQNLVWAEAFTAESYNSAWRNDPWLLKPIGDDVMSRGVNMFFIHGFYLNPFPDNIQPGITMGYWGTQYCRHLTWWKYASEWHRYLARCSYMLRQGRPVADVLVYPSELFFSTSSLYNDYRKVHLTDDVLMNSLAVDRNLLTLPNGNTFKVLVLKEGECIRPEALRKIKQLVYDGALLIGNPPPSSSGSLENYPSSDEEINALSKELWPDLLPDAFVEKSYGKGKILSGISVEDALTKVLKLPDLVVDSSRPEDKGDIVYIRRQLSGGELFFVSNQADEVKDIRLSIKVSGLQPEWWDPVKGTSSLLTDFEVRDGRTIIPVRMVPRQSGFVVFQDPITEKQQKTGVFSNQEKAQELSGAWTVNFDPRWGGPAEVVFNQLTDWATHSDENIRYYSGTATYHKTFDAETLNADALDLGKVKNLAKVTLNGKEMGIVWCAPWQVEIPRNTLKHKGNILEIEVINTWVNRMIGDEQEPEDCELIEANTTGDRLGSYDKKIIGRGLKDLPDWLIDKKARPSSKRYTFTSWRFYNKEAPLLSSGLLGPVFLKNNLIK